MQFALALDIHQTSIADLKRTTVIVVFLTNQASSCVVVSGVSCSPMATFQPIQHIDWCWNIQKVQFSLNGRLHPKCCWIKFSYMTSTKHNQITGLLLATRQALCNGLQTARSIALLFQEKMWLNWPAATLPLSFSISTGKHSQTLLL